MTKEEAIEILTRDAKIQKENGCLPDGIMAMEYAIQALGQEPDNDAISREYIKERLQWHKNYHSGLYKSLGQDNTDKLLYDATVMMINDIVNDVDNAPSVQPTRMRGKWISVNGSTVVYKCSNCLIWSSNAVDWQTGTVNYKFCPNCGSDNREEGE